MVLNIDEREREKMCAKKFHLTRPKKIFFCFTSFFLPHNKTILDGAVSFF